MPRNKPPKKKQYAVSLNTIPEAEECQLYTLMCIKSVSMLKKFTKQYGDAGRRMLIDIKYKLSDCPLTYLLIRDLVQDSKNWKINQPPEFSSIRVYFEDIRNGTDFTLFNHSKGISRGYYDDDSERAKFSKFEPERIKLYYRSESELFNENERVIVAKVLYTHAEMLKNYEELKRQQKLMKDADKLRGLY